MIIGLARNLNKDVMAEGIETVEQANLLRSLDCHSGQGFLYSRPVEVSVAAQLLHGSSADEVANKEK